MLIAPLGLLTFSRFSSNVKRILQKKRGVPHTYQEMCMKPHDLRLVIDPKDVSKRVEALAAEINRDYTGHGEIVVIGVLKGAFIFLADLVRSLTVPLKIDFIRVTSYGLQDESSGRIEVKKDLELPVEGRDVLLVEDIADTGLSLAWIVRHIECHNPSSLKVCVLIDKRERRECEVRVDYCGFVVEKGFLVGYGLDYSENYRHLRGIYEVCFYE